MSNFPGAEKIRELIDSLKKTVSEFAAAEEKLNSEFRVKSGKERQRLEDSTAELDQQLSTQLAETESSFKSAKAAADSKFQARKSAINAAYKASNKQALAAVENKEGRRKHKLQMETMQTNRTHESGLVATEKTFEDFKAALANDNDVISWLEKTARSYFRGYRKFSKFLSAAPTTADFSLDENQLISELHELLNRCRSDVEKFNKFLLPHFFRYRLVWLFLVLWQAPMVWLLRLSGINSITYKDAGISTGAFLVVGFVLHLLSKRSAEPMAVAIASALVKARKLHTVCAEKSEARFKSETARIENEFQQRTEKIQSEWGEVLLNAEDWRQDAPKKIDDKKTRAAATNERLYRANLEQLDRNHDQTIERLKRETEARKKELAGASEKQQSKYSADYQSQWSALEADWKNRIAPLHEAIHAADDFAAKLFPAWTPQVQSAWTPPQKFAHAAKFAQLQVDLEQLSGALPKDKRLALPGTTKFSVPLLLTYPQQGAVLFETTDAHRDEAVGALNNIILRLLSVAPPGRLNFTIFDPVELGQSFSGVMHLADYEEHLINSRIWTQGSQIEQKLADLNEHMEKVIQMYLRNEYATIAEYNEQAGNIAEKYHFLVVADFPVNFSDVAVKRLMSIVASGARCGVFTLIHWDRRQPAPLDLIPDELRKSSVWINWKGNEFVFGDKIIPGAKVLLDAPPASDLATELIHKIGVSSRDSNRVEVPFSHVAPADAALWSLETTSELRVPVGRTGATKLQYLAIGKGTRQHALVAGKTGSGKSTLFHVIITNLALWCSPEQVEFYLIDFKKGVEFKCYAAHQLPHARVVAIESDREFGLSVLQRIDEELRRRGEMFRKLGVQDVAGYKNAGGTEPMPRSLLLIDEFQEFFTEDDKISQGASVLLDRIVRQGRAFGIHVILGSQTLGGAYTVARTTLGQMVIRVALQCNEADAYLIMDDTNPAPRLLSRPGEGIYNDSAGALQGNSPFQVVWLPDSVRDSYLEKVRACADRSGKNYPGPIVFEGDAPADVSENPNLKNLLEAPALKSTASGRIWLGAPNSIKGPTETSFHRQSGNNLLIVGQRDEATLAIFSVGLISLAAQFPVGSANFILFDSTPPGTPERECLEKIVASIPHKIKVAKAGDVTETMTSLAEEMKRRSEDERAAEAPATFLLFFGLQKFGKLRYEDDFGFSSDPEAAANPGALLNKIICEGASLGFHVIASLDTCNNVNRCLSKKALSEFEMRVLFQMSANDSAMLIDSPKGGTLGLHRALLHNGQEGYLEVFRPYALPDGKWLEQAKQNLARLLK